MSPRPQRLPLPRPDGPLTIAREVGGLLAHRTRVVTRAGWVALLSAAVLWVAGGVLGWAELRLIAVAVSALFLLALALTLGGAPVDLAVTLDPARVRVGRTATGTLHARCTRSRAVRSAVVELPVGESVATFALRRLPPGESEEISFSIPTSRRGVIPVGPVTTVRGDPFGMARREVSASEQVELFVHPVLVSLGSLEAGLVRDLEGRPTADPSASDLDFHTLRAYVPGDDRRHIHWRSSARVSAARGSTTLMMKGYTDTRRSHVGIILDGRAASYVDDEAFEMAVTAAASIADRALRDEMDVTVVAAGHAMDRAGVLRTLDGFARVTPHPADLSSLSGRLMTLAPATSIAVVVTGFENPFADIQRGVAQFGPRVQTLALRVRPGQSSTATSVLGLSVLTMGDLADLRRLISLGGLS